MAALQYVDVPGYSALLLRRTYADLALPEALMDRAAKWLRNTDARPRGGGREWVFPSGATITFGYLDNENDKYRYQGAELQFIGFDEVSQFTETQYAYLFSRLRRKIGVPVPLRMRAASNPGGAGHAWVFNRFIVGGRQGGRVFIPAKLADNPFIDRAEYMRSLMELDPVTRAQLLDGLWITDPKNKPFKAEYWRGQNRYDIQDPALARQCIGRYLSWDTGLKDKDDSAYSALVVGEVMPDYHLVVREVWRERLLFPQLVDQIARFAREYNRDGKLHGVIIEDKASGISAYQTLMQTSEDWLRPLLIPFEPGGDKRARAEQAAVWCTRNVVHLPHPSNSALWLPDFEYELFAFPDSQYKDQVDAFTQLCIYLENYLAAAYWAVVGNLEDDDALVS